MTQTCYVKWVAAQDANPEIKLPERHAPLHVNTLPHAVLPIVSTTQPTAEHALVNIQEMTQKSNPSLCFGLTLKLLVANLANTKWYKKPEKLMKPWHMGTHLRVLSKS